MQSFARVTCPLKSIWDAVRSGGVVARVLLHGAPPPAGDQELPV
jgi:hypothetical protein